MRRNTITGILGTLIAAMPFLGFPNSIEKWMLFIAGGVIATIAFVISREHEKETVTPYSEECSCNSLNENNVTDTREVENE